MAIETILGRVPYSDVATIESMCVVFNHQDTGIPYWTLSVYLKDGHVYMDSFSNIGELKGYIDTLLELPNIGASNGLVR